MGVSLPPNSSWLQGRKYYVTRVALFIAACALIVSAMFMLNGINEQNTRNQQVASQMVQADSLAEVLVLASYDDADTATKLQRDGLLDLLRRSSVSADVEYLDARATAQNANVSTSTAAYGNALAATTWGQALSEKIAAHGKYSAVICIDDDALCFAEATRDSLFSTTPVVFLGVNDVAHANAAFQAGYATGLLEAYNARNTIETASAMRPNATNMLVITDNTATGTGDRAQFEQAVSENPDLFSTYSIQYANASRMSRADLAQQVANTNEDTILVYLDANADAAGNAYGADQTAFFLSQASAQPIYAIGLTGVGEGFAGSGFIDYEAEGQRAGEIVVSVLNGTRPADIPVETFTSEGSVYDTQVLGNYGIATGLVPASATLVNQGGFSLDSLRSIFMPVLLLVLGIACIVAFAFLGYRRTVAQMADIVTQRNALERRFYTDNLTEMPNMQWLTAFAGNEASSRVRSIVGIDLLEVDQLDETRGSGTSNEVIKVVAERLDGLDKAFIVRPGHSQFIIGTDRALKRGGKFLDEVESLLGQPVKVDGENISLTSCVGVYNRERGMSIEEMVSGVELAIRQAESTGSIDEVAFYDRHMREAEESKLAITSCLREAISQDDLHVLYQPQIELATSKVVGYEALVRLHGEPYPPDQFIPIAEASDQIIEIDRIVTRKVAQQLATWKKRKQRMVPVSINHSFGQLRDDKYVACAKEALDENKIAPKFLRVEIKEQLFLNNMAKATTFFDELREDGFGITIDGFGAGYTSLARVMQVPADIIKIDRSLTEGFLQGGDASVIANLVRLAHDADKQVVIEGVETAEQLQMCVEVGCDIVQGFYLSEPLLPEKALQFKPAKIPLPGDRSETVPDTSGTGPKVSRTKRGQASSSDDAKAVSEEPVVIEVAEPVEAAEAVEAIEAVEADEAPKMTAMVEEVESIEPDEVPKMAAKAETVEAVEAEAAPEPEAKAEPVVDAEPEELAVATEQVEALETPAEPAEAPIEAVIESETVTEPVEALIESETIEAKPIIEPEAVTKAAAEAEASAEAELEIEAPAHVETIAESEEMVEVVEPEADSEAEAVAEQQPEAVAESESEASNEPELEPQPEQPESKVARKTIAARMSAATSGVAAKMAARATTPAPAESESELEAESKSEAE
ncbi:ABC transporter substrate binding protein [Anaerotardibacter muris]|uniref:ABC transporter substrate binding protein n=1 Tax=Anaerotardibacter muris TaxID=2941505 RepID=UPI00204245E3|nr:ABC transporter substrate binding protein [Anaerotardibacter muris]